MGVSGADEDGMVEARHTGVIDLVGWVGGGERALMSRLTMPLSWM